jgi:GlpG protein
MRQSNMADSTTPVDKVDDGVSAPDGGRQPWVTYLCVAACVGVFLGLWRADNYESWETLAQFGYLPADEIWKGRYWALVTTAFVHFEIWHVAFNVYWLAVLGSRVEVELGSLRFLAFVFAAAAVSSTFQLAASGATGIGFSGVGYALFGLMWTARSRYPAFRQAVTDRVVQLFIGWLFACFLLTYTGALEVGNAAHVSGLLFGAGVAGAFLLPYRKRLVQIALSAMIVAAIGSLFWCPWSVPWLSYKAYAAHDAGDYRTAIRYYDRIIEKEPENSWASGNRRLAYQALGM